jgi:sugar-specific transcriptional regulator TrmB
MLQTSDLSMLERMGFSLYERKALVALALLGVADAESLCRKGEIPTSKIYRAMEKLAAAGLIEMQPTRPKLYAALPADVVVDRLVELARQGAQRLEVEAEQLRPLLGAVPDRLRTRRTFIDLATGAESHVKRHVTHLAAASGRILSYLERADLAALDQAVAAGFPILRRISRNAVAKGIDHRVVFGFSYQTAPSLVGFLRAHEADLRHMTGVRYSGELGHPFHVVDDEVVILPLDHPFVAGGRYASLLIRDVGLARDLATGFERLWEKAMRDLREITFQPVRGSAS